MRLRPYADTPGRLARQLLADLGILAWTAVWVRLGLAVHDTVARLAAAGYALESGATSVADNLHQAGDNVGTVPIVGGSLASPLDGAGSAAGQIADAGHQLGTGVATTATILGLLTAGPAIAVVVGVWATVRWRYARLAGTTLTLAASAAGRDLLALRALGNAPIAVLQALHEDPVAAWRRGEPDVVEALARLELADVGRALPRRRE
jgi:hypothetical protein